MTKKTALIIPVLPIREMVVFPGGRVPFVVGRRTSALTLERYVKTGDQIALLTQKDPKTDEPTQGDLFEVGCLAHVESLVPLPNRFFKIGVKGVARVRLCSLLGGDEMQRAEVEVLDEPDVWAWEDGGDESKLELENAFYHAAAEFFGRNRDAARIASMDDIRRLPINQAIDAIAGLINAGAHEKQLVLEQVEIQPRLEAIMCLLQTDSDRFNVDRDVEHKTRQRLDEGHKQFVLNEKMRVIQEELGKKDDRGEKKEFALLRQRILDAGMSEEAQTKALEELERLESQPHHSEADVSRTYINWLLALPWTKMAEESLDLYEAEKILNEDHAGLEKVKERIIEYLAVMSRLRGLHKRPPTKAAGEDADREPTQQEDAGEGGSGDLGGKGKKQAPPEPNPLKGPILCLAGPPGVGKTSLARSIAKALNRPFVRCALGGMNDEAEIRGHRKTYIGSMPGRIISLIKKAGVKNPLMLLDELDKMGSDLRGDPAFALLEVLDPEQNTSFQDNYLDVGFDLSQVLFLCTANVPEQIPEVLADRLEIIRLSGYTPLEKGAIAKEHLIPKSLESHGMTDLGVRFESEAIDKIIQAYTKEAGVRQLEREISSILRKLARHSLQSNDGEEFDPLVSPSRIQKLLGPEKHLKPKLGDGQIPGIVNGLAWTAAGGDLLTIEATALPGKGELKLTGKLGDVMQESAQIALSFVRARAEKYGLEKDFLDKLDIHLHVPEGAIPKDGPSAGITMAAALVSALTGIPAKLEVAMTGELTLRGMVLPIGGLKEKLLAAHRMGRNTILIPRENERHLEDVPEEVKSCLTIHLVNDMDEVIPLALTRTPG